MPSGLCSCTSGTPAGSDAYGGIAWSPDSTILAETIVYNTNLDSYILLVPASGGTTKRLIASDTPDELNPTWTQKYGACLRSQELPAVCR